MLALRPFCIDNLEERFTSDSIRQAHFELHAYKNFDLHEGMSLIHVVKFP